MGMVLASVTATSGVLEAQELVPAARSRVDGEGRVRFSNRILVEADRLRPQAQALAMGLQRLGVEATVVSDGAAGDGLVRFEQGEPGDGLAYRIRARGSEVRVLAEDGIGAAHAAASLMQLVTLDAQGASWPVTEIEDAPDLPYRCFMVDMGRNPHGPGTLRAVVDMCWLYKVNLLQLHLTDDQLFSWPSKAYPELLSANAGWCWEDFVALEAYSQARGVAIVPELEVPGHSSVLRRTYPEVFGETPEELAASPEAQRGIETLLRELASVFEATPYMHIGGDEAYGVPQELQRDLINHLNGVVRSLGKRTVVWEGPRLGQGENKVDEDVIHLNWRTIDFPARDMLAAGYEVVNASWDPLYIVDHYPRTMFTAVDVERCYDWDPRVFKHVNPGIPTFGKPHRVDSVEGILGFCMPWWEGREENLLPLCLPRLAAVATAAWNRAGERDFASYQRRNERVMARFWQLAGVPEPSAPRAEAVTPPGNLALGRPVRASTGAAQPPFGPERLTNGVTDFLDHFLGYPTVPEPLEIVIELDGTPEISKIVVYETAVGGSYEQYRVEVSQDGQRFEKVGEAWQGTRGEANHVVHELEPRPVGYVKIVTDGNKAFVFASFSRLTEVQVFE